MDHFRHHSNKSNHDSHPIQLIYHPLQGTEQLGDGQQALRIHGPFRSL